MPKATMITNRAVLAEMQKEIWAMEPKRLEAFLLQIGEASDVEYDIEAATVFREVEDSFKLIIENGVAIIPISGVLMKNVPFIFKLFDIEATTYSDIQEQLNLAVEADAVDSIVLRIDSPGGTVAGSEEAARAINDAKAVKPVHAVVEDQATSGAYWLASQALTVTANANSITGSIGVFTVAVDLSKMAENEGVKVTVIRSGEHKGSHVPGSEVTDSHIEAIQEVIDGMAQNFITAVAEGRGMTIEAVTALADGRVWLADRAVKNGLIDNIGNLDSTLNSMKGANVMAKTDNEEQVDSQKIERDATLAEQTRFTDLKAAFPDNLAFAVEQFQSGASVTDAKVAYNSVLQDQLKAAEAQNADLTAKVEKAEATASTDTDGADPITGSGDASAAGGEPRTFMEAAHQIKADRKVSKKESYRLAAKEYPELHGKQKCGG